MGTLRSAVAVLVLLGGLALAGPGRAAAPPYPSAVRGRPAEVFGLNRLWRMHLIVQPADWNKMPPSRGGMGRPAPARADSGDRKARGGFGFDFEYVKADLVIDGTRLSNVAVRFKGNVSYAQAAQTLKRPFRIAFDRHVPGQTFKGLRKVSLNNLVMDPTAARESLSFALYRAAGVPAPRTAHVELTLTVPGKHDRELLGLYTLIEAVDRPFLADRFGSDKGMLLKPERIGPLDYLGENWPAYASKYRPKTRSGTKAQRRLIDLAWLVQQSDDELFRRDIAAHIDVDRFLRYLAATVLLSSVDSFVGLGHNYYLYLDPKTARFTFIPWDLDHSFGGLSFLGSAASMADLSIRQPQLGRNRLVERLLADEKCFAVYREHLRGLLAREFTAAKIGKDLAGLAKLTGGTRQREQKAAKKRGEKSWMSGLGILFTPSSDLAGFARRRAVSVEEQLAGKRKGTVLKFPFSLLGDAHWVALPRPILDAADRNRDGRLSRQEAEAAARSLFRACDRAGKKSIDEKALATGLARLGLPATRGQTKRALAQLLARTLFAQARRAAPRQPAGAALSEEALVSTVDRLFTSAGPDRAGLLDERKLAAALFRIVPPPPGPFAPRPDPATKEEKRK